MLSSSDLLQNQLLFSNILREFFCYFKRSYIKREHNIKLWLLYQGKSDVLFLLHTSRGEPRIFLREVIWNFFIWTAKFRVVFWDFFSKNPNKLNKNFRQGWCFNTPPPWIRPCIQEIINLVFNHFNVFFKNSDQNRKLSILSMVLPLN